MKKILLQIFLFAGFCAKALNPIPSVPSSITIAEMKLKINHEAQREIQKDVDALRASDKYFQVKLDRVNLYFPLIEKALREEGVPEDLKYLSVQESALISDAVSSADAVGYWQFKDFTAKEVGLRVDRAVDERKNIIASSHGAAKYLKRNNFYVKNWMYAVNAYMTGPGGVKKYVDEKDIGADHMEITGKTHWYVKRFIAHVIAFKDEVGAPHSEGLSLNEYTNGANKTLEQVGKELKVDEELLTNYNKWLHGGRIPDDKTYWVIIPVVGKVPAHIANQGKYHQKIEEPKAGSKSSGNRGAVEKNVFTKKNDRRVIMATSADDIASLAKKSNLLNRQLVKYNDLLYGEKIKKGELYYIQNKRNSADVPYHVVQYGETLWEISHKHGVKLKKVLKKNRMKSPDKVEAGRVLWLKKKRPRDTPIEYKELKKSSPTPVSKVQPKAKPVEQVKEPVAVVKKPVIVAEPVKEEPTVVVVEPKVSPAPSKNQMKHTKIHVVQTGESLWTIAKYYDVSVQEVMEWNHLAQDPVLKPGQELLLTPRKGATPPKAKTYKTYIVKQGDTLYGIARKFDLSLDELKKLNDKAANEISIGETLRVEK